jgi:hypothetical protein
MQLWQKIIAAYPEIESTKIFDSGIWLQDDGDGVVYIKEWNYSKPIPNGFNLGKP